MTTSTETQNEAPAIPEAHSKGDKTLVAFRDGSYKKIKPVKWKHSQWIHFTLDDGSVVRVNPVNVNYLHDGVN